MSLDDLYDRNMCDRAVPDSFDLKGMHFDLIHVKLRSSSRAGHAVALCASDRLVAEEPLAGKIPGLYGKIPDSDGGFFYECYVSSPFLDEAVRPERTGFDIAERHDGLFAQTELSMEEIRRAILGRAAEHLKPQLTANLGKARERVQTFVAERAPRYRPILKRIPDTELNVDPGISDKELDLTLHKFLSEFESELIAEGHDIMAPTAADSYENYRKRLEAYLRKAEDIKRSDLANYVSHRKVIIDLLSTAIRPDAKGKYGREDLIHNLIMPMGKTTDEVHFDGCNLWVVNERLAFHNYLASDKTLRSLPITGSEATKEPDICCLNVFDNPMLMSEGKNIPLASITIVEIKRPMRNDAAPGEESDPIEQSIGYLQRIRNGAAMTAEGRPIPRSENIPGYCYVLADLTPRLRERCLLHHDLIETADSLGFFGYKKNCRAFVEVISFDQLVNAAKERNRAFFDKLGLPTN